MFSSKFSKFSRAIAVVLLLFTLSSPTVAASASPHETSYISSYLCNQRLQYTRAQKFFHWPGLATNSSLQLPACPSALWFEGHEPTGRRRIPIVEAGSLFHGCVDYRRHNGRGGGLQINLRPDRCRQLKDPSLSLTCVPPGAGPVASAVTEVHVLQLANDLRCPPGTGRDRLGLCRQCGDNSGRDRCCWQPFWDAECPLSCGRRSSYDRSIVNVDGGDGDVRSDVLDAEPQAFTFPRLLHRDRRAATTTDNVSGSSYVAAGKVKVAQLACPYRISLVATITCLMEMHSPTRAEAVSLLVIAFTTVAFLSMPILVGYSMGQVFAARFLPFLQFHLFERSALLSSSMRTQAIFAPSLWDFKAFREAEKRQRLVQNQLASQLVEGFQRREFQNLLLWKGVPE